PVIQAEEAREAKVRSDEIARLEAQEALRAAARSAEAAQRRLTIRGLFEQWQRAELTPHLRADGTRTGRKDGGEWIRHSFERRLFPTLGDRAAEDTRKADLLAVLDACK